MASKQKNILLIYSIYIFFVFIIFYFLRFVFLELFLDEPAMILRYTKACKTWYVGRKA